MMSIYLKTREFTESIRNRDFFLFCSISKLMYPKQ